MSSFVLIHLLQDCIPQLPVVHRSMALHTASEGECKLVQLYPSLKAHQPIAFVQYSSSMHLTGVM